MWSACICQLNHRSVEMIEISTYGCSGEDLDAHFLGRSCAPPRYRKQRTSSIQVS